MITFVTFHVDRPAEPTEADRESKNPVPASDHLTAQLKSSPTPINDNNNYDYQLAIELMFQSADRFHPNCRKVILTDFKTNFINLSSDIEVFRQDVDVSQIMYSRLLAQYEFLKNEDFSSDLVLLDSDIIINDNIEDLFEGNFNIGLTVREDPKMPINGGIIYVSQDNKEKVISFFAKLVNVYRQKYQEFSQWWGDQLALADVMGWNGDSFTSDTYQVEGATIRFLDCNIYNFSPNYESELDAFASSKAKIVHFKGPRKLFVKAFWDYNFFEWPASRLTEIIQRLQENRSDLREEKDILTVQLQETKNQAKRLEGRNKHLEGKNKKLEDKRQEILDKYEALKVKHQELGGKYQELGGKYQELGGKYQELGGKYQELGGKYQEKISQYKQLKNDYNILTSSKFFKLREKWLALKLFLTNKN